MKVNIHTYGIKRYINTTTKLLNTKFKKKILILENCSVHIYNNKFDGDRVLIYNFGDKITKYKTC